MRSPPSARERGHPSRTWWIPPVGGPTQAPLSRSRRARTGDSAEEVAQERVDARDAGGRGQLAVAELHDLGSALVDVARPRRSGTGRPARRRADPRGPWGAGSSAAARWCRASRARVIATYSNRRSSSISSSSPVAMSDGMHAVGGVDHVHDVPLEALRRMDRRQDEPVLVEERRTREVARRRRRIERELGQERPRDTWPCASTAS